LAKNNQQPEEKAVKPKLSPQLYGVIIFKSEILLKWAWLRVAMLHSLVRAMAAMRVSLSPIGCP
jgi:hypothetical protein